MIDGEKVNKEINEDLPNQFSNLKTPILYLEHLKVLVMGYIMLRV
jgi:hypothetical protein